MNNLITDRNRAFRETCLRIMESSPRRLSESEIIERALAHPAPGYYVTYAYALRRIRDIRKLDERKAAKAGRGRWKEMSEKVEALCARWGVSVPVALVHVLNAGTASSFFLHPTTACRIYRGTI